jgi:putative ABC transport system permease protein
VTRRTARRRDAERARAEQDVVAELAFHRRCTIDELVRAGLSPHDAAAEATRRFGPEREYRQDIVAVDLQPEPGRVRRAMIGLIAGSLRAVARDIRRAPGFTLGVVSILTLGLGVNAVTFGLVDRLVLSGPAGVKAPDSLRRVVLHRHTDGGGTLAVTTLGYLDYEDFHGSQIAGAAAESSTPLLTGSGDRAERIQGVLVTGGYFPLLGVSPAAGRFFTDDESSGEGDRLVVLGFSYWQRRYGGDLAAIGKTIDIEDHRYTIVGVAPRGFTGSSVARADVFLPLEAAHDAQVTGPWRTTRNFRWMGVVVRLAPGADAAAAADEATARYRHEIAADGTADAAAQRDSFELAPLNALGGPTASNDAAVAALVGVVALVVLLIAFTNVANLFLARSLRRRDRMALRLALGGARWRLVGEEAAEGAWLALAGAAVAVTVAWAAAPAVRQLLFPRVAWVDAPVRPALLLGLAAVAVVGGGLAAALPMWSAGRSDVAAALKTGTQRGPRRRTRMQSAMLMAQAALSVLLLVGAGLFVRSLAGAQSLDLGLDTSRLLVVSTVAGERPLAPDFADELRRQIANMPGVAGTTMVAGTLPFVSGWGESLHVPGLPKRPRVADGGPYIHAVEPGYFSTVGTRVLEGRPFTGRDVRGAPRVVIVNQSMARLYWPGRNAIGQCLQIGDGSPPCSTIVGIAENTHRQAIVEGESLLYYIPLDQASEELKGMARPMVRLDDDGLARLGAVSDTIRREALALDPSLRYVSARSMDDIISPQLRTWRLGAGLFGVFGVLALVVAAIGLYSVVAFDVEGRRREMGLRAALGATSSSIVRLVVGGALRSAIAGVALGLAIAWLLAPLASPLFYGVSGTDAAAFLGAAMLLIVAATGASALPGLRAARVDPSTALRDE